MRKLRKIQGEIYSRREIQKRKSEEEVSTICWMKRDSRRVDFWIQQNLEEKFCIIPRLPAAKNPERNLEKNLERKLKNSDERKRWGSQETSEEEFKWIQRRNLFLVVLDHIHMLVLWDWNATMGEIGQHSGVWMYIRRQTRVCGLFVIIVRFYRCHSWHGKSRGVLT